MPTPPPGVLALGGSGGNPAPLMLPDAPPLFMPPPSMMGGAGPSTAGSLGGMQTIEWG